MFREQYFGQTLYCVMPSSGLPLTF